ncbi:MAG: hypothetical protein JEZ02_00280 [Desulfatibacillum sp.]|nr:hypothetical protein [Desulfatibacillum sp.]
MPEFVHPKIAGWSAFVLVAGAYAIGLITSIADPDMWGYLAFGYTFWTQPGFPYLDPFSYMPTNPVWIYHEWLTGVIFFPLYASFGDAALQILRYGLAAGALGFAFAAAKKRGASPAAALLGLFFPVFAISAGYAPVRAQVFTYFFFALTIYLCEDCRKSQQFKRLWLLPPLVLVWCNLHGGFVAGLAIIGLYGLGQALSRRVFKPYLLILVPCLLVTLINPYGWDYWPYLIKAILMPRPEITEWMSLWRAYKLGQAVLVLPLYIGMLPLCILFCVGPLRRDRTAILVLAATAWMAFSHVRHLPFMGLAMAALLPSAAGYFWKNNLRGKVFVLFAVIIPLAHLTIINGMVAYNRLDSPGLFRTPLSLEVLPSSKVLGGQMAYPTTGIAFLKENGISGNILTEFEWGQFVMWTLPDSKVAMDGRYETVYPDSVCREFFAFVYGSPGGAQYLEKYPHEIALLKTGALTSARVKQSPEWTRVYEGDGCAVFLRKKNS